MKNSSILLVVLILFSCADVLPPSGGDKDTTAPKVTSTNPKNLTTNFNTTKIDIKFNEFFKFNSSSNNFSASPSLKSNPRFFLNGKKLSIIINEQLLPNTTYIFNFTEAIKDITEGNTLNDFKYVFSTGSFLDSLEIKGLVLNAYNNKPVENTLVMLYPENEDSILYKKPFYFVKTNSKGEYQFNFLKKGLYKIAVLEDKNLNFIYDQESERIAFYDTIINLNKNKIIKPLYLFENIRKNELKSAEIVSENHLLLSFAKAFSTIELEISNYEQGEIVYFSKDKKDLHYWFFPKQDATQFEFYIDDMYLDSLTTNLKEAENAKSNFNILIEQQKINTKNEILLNFPFPIKSFNPELLSISDKENNNINYLNEWENNNTTLKIMTTNYKDSIKVDIKEQCFESYNSLFNQVKNKELHNFEVKTSTLSLKIPQKEVNQSLQLLDKEYKVIEELNVSRETIVFFENLKIGNYFVRIFEDKNNNGIWDNGLFHVKQLPEKTLFFSDIIILKENWDKELELKY